jgi:hypothetical protein
MKAGIFIGMGICVPLHREREQIPQIVESDQGV